MTPGPMNLILLALPRLGCKYKLIQLSKEYPDIFWCHGNIQRDILYYKWNTCLQQDGRYTGVHNLETKMFPVQQNL